MTINMNYFQELFRYKTYEVDKFKIFNKTALCHLE